MSIPTERTLDRLCCEQPCLGIVCSSFTFDPKFFEEHFLRAVLRLSSDPEEQPQRYYAEALRGLQETPVAVFTDAGQRQAGRRLPYDVLEVDRTVFHPKSVLLLFDEHARLLIGSGNLTFSGYSQNTELFIALDLRYHNDQDAALLRSFVQHLERIQKLARQTGSQLSLVRDELQRRLNHTADVTAAHRYALLDSAAAPIIHQIPSLLPEHARITNIGMAAPFYECDDGSELDSTSVFGALRSRAAKDVTLDVAVSWENAQVQSESGKTELQDGLNRLWTWKSGDDENTVVEYLVPTAITPSKMKYLDHCGSSKHWDLQESLGAVDTGAFWMLPRPVVYAPRKSLKAAQDVYSNVGLWLHPAARLVDGRTEHRPLHAKLLLIGFRSGNASRTLVVTGSANMSRKALLLSVNQGGNAELGIAFIVDGDLRLTDFLPELVSVPMELLELNEREFPEAATNWTTAITTAIHDPVERTLAISWSDLAANLPSWQLLYDDRELAADAVPPAPLSSLTISDFVLQPATAEIVLRVCETDYSIPILVTDLAELPIVDGGGSIGLNDLLLLLGRRIGSEQAIYRAQTRTANDLTELNEVFGSGFTPTDVFRAWWTVAHDLQDTSLSVNSFRLHLNGSMSVGFAWTCMNNAIESQQMDRTEAWFYGSELLRELEQVELEERPDRAAKLSLLECFRNSLRNDLAGLAPGDDEKWIRSVRRFYSGAKR